MASSDPSRQYPRKTQILKLGKKNFTFFLTGRAAPSFGPKAEDGRKSEERGPKKP
jgi:hypothetical protein